MQLTMDEVRIVYNSLKYIREATNSTNEEEDLFKKVDEQLHEGQEDKQ